MVRIGRQIPHFREVEPTATQAEFSDDRRFRYLLKVRYRDSLYDAERSGRAAVVLKNPSSADMRAADSTIRKVETFIYHRLDGVAELSILNLFGLRATDAADLNREFRIHGAEGVIGPDNDRTLKEEAEAADYVVVAWGGPSGIDKELYGERVRQVKHLLSGIRAGNVFEVRGDREYRQPLHGMMWGYGHRLVPYKKLKSEE